MAKGDLDLRLWVRRLLLGGVALSGCLMAAGLLAHGLGGAPGLSWIRAGLMILMLTPVARVLVLAAGYALKGDWAFCGISLAVLLLLGAGILLGVKP